MNPMNMSYPIFQVPFNGHQLSLLLTDPNCKLHSMTPTQSKCTTFWRCKSLKLSPHFIYWHHIWHVFLASLIFPMFFSEKFKPIGVPTHPLDPSDIDAQTKGARTSIVRLHLWQQVPVTSFQPQNPPPRTDFWTCSPRNPGNNDPIWRLHSLKMGGWKTTN